MGMFDKFYDSLEQSDESLDKETDKQEGLDASSEGLRDSIVPQGKPRKKRPSLTDIGADEPLWSNREKTDIIRCNKDIKYISQRLSSTPNGIIECKVPHIGAVYLEMHTDRDSVIIVPSKERALLYGKEYGTLCFVPDQYESPNKIKDKWKSYKENHKVKKIVTSICTFFLPEDYKKHYFVMIKDMDELQSDYMYDCQDIYDLYFSIPEKSRCLYTYCSDVFTHPKMNNEPVTVISWENCPVRHLEISPCRNIVGKLRKVLEEVPRDEKVLVAYSSVQLARLSILNLKEEMQQDSCIICDEGYSSEAGEFFFDNSNVSDILPKRITFIVEKYPLYSFSGTFNLITVSDAEKGSTLLSEKQIMRTYYLCVAGKGNVIRDILVHNTSHCWASEWEKEIRALKERGEKVAYLMNEADRLSEDDSSLQRLFGLTKTMLVNRSRGGIRGRFSRVQLVHKNGVETEWEANYLNIDNLKLRTRLLLKSYSKPNALSQRLGGYMDVKSLSEDDEPADERQTEIAAKEKGMVLAKKMQVRSAVLDEFAKVIDENKEFDLGQALQDIMQDAADKDVKMLLRDIKRLYRYIDFNVLVKELKEVKTGNRTGFKNLNNSIMVWALDDGHPLKTDMYKAFDIGKIYTNDEIIERLTHIVKYHFNRDFIKEKEDADKEKVKGKAPERTQRIDRGRKLVTVFKYFFDVERIPREGYKITGYKSFGNTSIYNGIKRKRISKDDNNLMRYFMF